MTETQSAAKQPAMKKLLKLSEVADLLNVGYPRAAKLVRLGILPTIRLGRHWRVDPVKLQEFLDCGGAALPDVNRVKPAA